MIGSVTNNETERNLKEVPVFPFTAQASGNAKTLSKESQA
jgi:hypothetical protein